MKSLTLYLEPNYEKTSEFIPDGVKDAFLNPDNLFFMQHQIDTYISNKDYQVVLNTYPTGTGKTRASLLHLIDKPYENALFIAPTNELISQHVEDIKKFIASTKLTHIVIELNAKILDALLENVDIVRKGEILYRLITNPKSEEFLKILEIDNNNYNSPIILVTNPDIFYYAITFGYNNNDKRNIFHVFFGSFSYFVIDEFHYYNSKQLCSFLFFISLALSFGHLDQGKRITILTATPLPEVIKFFDRLETQGLKYKILEPSLVNENDKNAIRTLSKVKVMFYELDQYNFKNAVSSNIDFIESNYNNKKDGAIISNSLININDSSNYLVNKNISDIGLITGVIDKIDRKNSIKKRIILATPTVDIGYNFDKENKDRQNIDFLVFDFRYEDQFWQRLGRAGRILGKKEKDIQSEVLVFVSEQEIKKLLENFKQDELLSRQDFFRKTKTNSIFKMREDFSDYVQFLGFSEMARPLENLRQIFSKDKEYIVTKELFNMVSTVFSGKEKNYYVFVQKVFKRFKDIEKAKLNILETPKDLFDEFLAIVKNNESLISRIDQTTMKVILQKKDMQKQLSEYINEEYYLMKGLYSFRESFEGLTSLVYDPKNFMTQSSKAFTYDLFHILKYYEVKFFSSSKEFYSNSGLDKLKIKEKDLFYCEILERVPENQVIDFNLNFDGTLENFQERYINKLTSKNNFEFNIKVISNFKTVDKSKDIRLIKAQDIFRERYIPCLILDSTLIPICFKNGIIPKNLKLICNGIEKDYKVIFGASAYLIAPKITKILDLVERKTKYFIV